MTPTTNKPLDQATPGEQILLAQLHQVQRALEQAYSQRREQEAETAACADRIAALEAELTEARAHLGAVLASRSWRLTAPLRRILGRHR